ncbi:hypothetical protein BJX99DRAFT_225671 [Aspergillus californicus]
MSDNAKSALRAETHSLVSLASDIVLSGAYLYPFKGIIHLLRTPSLTVPLKTHLLKTLVAGVSITTALFVFTYVPQTGVLAFVSGPFAPIAGALLVLAEASAVTRFVARGFIIREALIDVFDAVLLQSGHEDLVARGREVKGSSSSRGGVMNRLGKLLRRPFGGVGFADGDTDGTGGKAGIVKGMVRSLMLLPLNFVPVVGTVLYVYVSGKRVGPGMHERYFQLRGFDEGERREWVGKRRGGYIGLGMTSVLLEMVPFASMVFEFSNAVGAALWAGDMERATRTQ